jgi:hypothetical protein
MLKESFLKHWKNTLAWLKSRLVSLKNIGGSLKPYERLSLIISLLGLASLALIMFQINQASASLQAASYQSIANNTLELDKIFIDKPELRPYFYYGRDINQNEKDYDLVMAVAEFLIDFFDSTLTQLEIMPKDKQLDMPAWKKYFSDSFANSPALCKRLQRNPNWYRPNLIEIASEPCANMGVNIK